MISTRGASGSGGNGTTAPRARAALRRRGLGSEGIGTERVVGQRHEGFASKWSVPLAILPRDIAGHIQRGGGTGPMKPRQPPSHSTGRCQFLRDVWRVSPRPHGGRRRHERENPNGCFSAHLSRMRRRLPARGALRLPSLLRPARGQVRQRPPEGRPAGAAPAHPVRARRTSGATRTSCPSRRRPARAPAPRRARACPPAARRWSRPTASPSASGLREVWVKNDAANPTHSFKDRVVAVAAAARARAGLRHARVRVDRQPRQRGRRARARRWASRPTSSSRPTSRSRRSSRPASTGRTWSRSRATTTTSTACAPSCRASTSRGRS